MALYSDPDDGDDEEGLTHFVKSYTDELKSKDLSKMWLQTYDHVKMNSLHVVIWEMLMSVLSVCLH